MANETKNEANEGNEAERVELTDEQWRARLSGDEYEVLRKKGTDRPFSGEYTHPGHDGVFVCAGCGAPLFESTEQFDSGSGWPSFSAPADPERVELHADASHGMVRTEVVCARCGGHLGHLFPDGPRPTGERWCINSTSLKLAD